MRPASLLCASLEIDQAQDHGREDELHREPHLAPRHHDVVRSAHPRVVQHGYKIGKVDALGVGEADYHHGLIRGGYVLGDERVTGVHRRYTLEVDVGAAELRTDMVHVVGHAPQDRVDHGLLAVAAMMPVAMQLLDPLEIDDRHDADEQIDVVSHIDAIADVSAMQAFVEQQVAAAVGSLHALAHLDAVVAVKGIALDYLRPDAFAAEDMREALHDRGGSRTGGSGHRDYRMADGHAELPGTDRPAWAALKAESPAGTA